MAYDAALKKHPNRVARRDERSEPPTIEVDIDGRKVSVRQQTIPSGLGYGLLGRLKRFLG